MSTYDPEIIQKFADRLYARSVGVIFVSAALGVLIGLVAGPFIQQALPPKLALALPEWATAVVLGVLGFLQGMERAFLLKLQAQSALCQLQIEKNTRPAKGAANAN